MKRFISFLTAFSITLMLLPWSSNIAEAATVGGCSGHSGMTAWTDTTSLPKSGNYYLDVDVQLSTWEGSTMITGDLTLCLNGHTIRAANKNRIFYISDGTLTLYDCKETGRLIGGDISGNGNNAAGRGGVIHMWPGTVNMYGGTISGGTAYSGGGVYMASSGSTVSKFNMYGGKISGNKAIDEGGGIWVNATSTVCLTEMVSITGNTKNGSASNVYLLDDNTITIGSSFSTSSKVGVTTTTKPTNCTSYVNVTGTTTKDVISCFTADENGKSIVYNDNKVQLTGAHGTAKQTTAKAATCTADGNVEYWTCQTCRKNFGSSACTNELTTTVTNATGHNYSNAWTTSDTQHWHKCTNTGCTSTSNTATHTWDSGTVTKAATCTATGTKKFTCLTCSNTKNETIPAKNHNYGSWSVTKNPSLTATGTAKRTCANDSSHTETKDVPALSTANGWTKSETTEPTIDTDGSYTYTSTEYGDITVTVPNLKDSSWAKTETKKPTVDENGEYTYTSDYGEVKATVPNLKDPKWTKNPTKKPTVNENGEYTYTSDYGEVKVDVPNLKDPVWEKTDTTEPTVNDNGSYTYTSTDYGDVTVTVPNLSDPSVWTKDESQHLEPDEYTDGKDVYTSVYGEIEVILPALGHTHNLTQVAAKEATCTAAGNGAYWTCSGCGKHFSDENGETENSIPTISALGHNYVDGKCTRCGEGDPSHEHNFVDGVCICGEPDPSYVPTHEHNFVNGTCECGEPDPDYDPTSDPSHKHTFMNGVCDCGAIDPTYNTNNTNGEVTSDTPIENVLTPEEIAEINNGHSFEIVLEVTDIRNSVSYTDVAAASSVLNSGQEIGVYLDLSLFKVMDGTVRTQITDATGPIGITLTIPNDIYASDRTYYIIRVHNGTAENIGGTYDRTNNTLTFYTDKFSTYAIAFTASSVSIDSPTIPSRPSVPTVPTNPTPVPPSVSPSVSPSEPDATPTVTETAPQVEEEVISDDEPYVEDVSSGAADDSDDGGITDMSMEVIILAIAAVIVAVILVKKIIF